MEEKDRKAIIERCDELKQEIYRQNLKIQTFTEVIVHLRSRILRAERRKKEIHFEICDLKDEVRALEAGTAYPSTDSSINK